MKKIIVIIVTFNGKQWYDRCFSSLQNSELPLQIVLIDNASSDNTVEYIKRHFPKIYVIKSDKNLGFGQANNIGMRYALQNGADYVFLLNQDAWIEPNTIKDLIEVHKKNPEYGILSPIHLNADKTQIEKGLMHYIADYKITSTDLINDLYFRKEKEIYETNYINAAAWLLPTRTLNIIGGFDPIFFHYGEDDNYMQRVKYHKMKIGICPGVTIVHDTDIRIKSEEKAQQNNKKTLLVELTNINNNTSVYKSMFLYIKRAIKHILKMKFCISVEMIKTAFYIFTIRKNIIKSRTQNKENDVSWLNI